MKLIWLIIFFIATIAIYTLGFHSDWVVVPTFPKVSAFTNDNPIPDPTGCPYGDAVSLKDCDKFAPQAIPQPENFQGK